MERAVEAAVTEMQCVLCVHELMGDQEAALAVSSEEIKVEELVSEIFGSMGSTATEVKDRGASRSSFESDERSFMGWKR